jgi:hypothetical protein
MSGRLAFFILFFVAPLLCMPTTAQEFIFTADIPIDIGTTFYTPNQVIRKDSVGNFSLYFDGPAHGLGPGVHISSLAALPQGDFLFTADAPFKVGSTTYSPRDVMICSGGSVSLWYSLTLPAGTIIDALAIDSAQQLYFSFDAPVTFGSTTFQPNDIAISQGAGLAFFLSGSALGIPMGSNVVGFDRTPNGDSFFMFDTPATVGGATYLPTQIARYSGGTWSLFWSSGAGAGGAVATFSFPPPPGPVPGGGGVSGTPLTLAKSGSDLDLAWGPSCTTDANDYAVYRGTLGTWYRHGSVLCTTGGSTSATVSPTGGNEYYLVVPLNGIYEGSYGTTSAGAQIPPSAVPCRNYSSAGECP